MSKFKFGFIYIDPAADSSKHRTEIVTGDMDMKIIAVKDQDEGAEVAKTLLEQGVQGIELCGGFGPIGASKVLKATGEKIPVGFVLFGCESTEKYADILRSLG